MYGVIDVVKDLVTGKIKFAPRNVVRFRRNVCSVCVVRDTRINKCTACGCWLPAKIRLQKSSCPLELW